MTGNVSYKTSDGEVIAVTTYGKKDFSYKGCLIFVHGFKGFKDWGFGPYVGNYFAEAGYYFITFNFSHNGVKGNSREFTEIDKFAANTYSREIDELNELINAIKSGYFGSGVGKLKLGLIGHSRGGAISIISASRNKIDAIVTWSAIAKLDRFSDRQKKDWRKKGVYEVINSRTKQIMRLNVTLLDDIEKNSQDKLNIKKTLMNLDKPHLIIHGQQDLAVPITEAENLFEWSNKHKTEYVVISNTGHTFGIKYPFEGSNDKFDEVLSATSNFFSKWIN